MKYGDIQTSEVSLAPCPSSSGGSQAYLRLMGHLPQISSPSECFARFGGGRERGSEGSPKGTQKPSPLPPGDCVATATLRPRFVCATLRGIKTSEVSLEGSPVVKTPGQMSPRRHATLRPRFVCATLRGIKTSEVSLEGSPVVKTPRQTSEVSSHPRQNSSRRDRKTSKPF